MKSALEMANLTSEKIDYINAHGTSTIKGDAIELNAISRLFKHEIFVSSTKSSIGHLLGAAGGVEAVFSILSIRDNIIPPTINLNEKDPECDLDYVPNNARETKIDVSMSNSFGFGGTNGTLIFKRM